MRVGNPNLVAADVVVRDVRLLLHRHHRHRRVDLRRQRDLDLVLVAVDADAHALLNVRRRHAVAQPHHEFRNLLHIDHIFGVVRIRIDDLGAPGHLLAPSERERKNEREGMRAGEVEPRGLAPVRSFPRLLYLQRLLLLHHLLIRDEIPLRLGRKAGVALLDPDDLVNPRVELLDVVLRRLDRLVVRPHTVGLQ